MRIEELIRCLSDYDETLTVLLEDDDGFLSDVGQISLRLGTDCLVISTALVGEQTDEEDVE